MCIMNSLKKLMLFKLLILVIKLKKLTITQKMLEIEKKMLHHNHDKYITT